MSLIMLMMFCLTAVVVFKHDAFAEGKSSYGSYGNPTSYESYGNLNTGNLTLENVVEGTAGDKNHEFYFTITLNNSNINGEYGEVTFIDGVSSVIKLKHGDKITIIGLPEGTEYAITETNAEGYTVSSQNQTGVIPNDSQIDAKFINQKDAVPEEPTEPEGPEEPIDSDVPLDSDEPVNSDEPVDSDESANSDEPADSPSPKTGDFVNIEMNILLIVLASFSFAIILIFKKKIVE